jgi:hypothetical protein
MLQHYGLAKVARVLKRVFKFYGGQYIGLSQGKLSLKVGLPLNCVSLPVEAERNV